MSFFHEKFSFDHSGWSPYVVPSFGLARISCDLGSPILSRTDPYSHLTFFCNLGYRHP